MVEDEDGALITVPRRARVVVACIALLVLTT